MKKRLFSLLAACALLCSCANVTLQPSTPPTQEEYLYELVESLPQTDELQGSTLTVLTADPSVLLGDEEAAGSVRPALKNRNLMLENVYGMLLQVTTVREDRIIETLKSASEAGVPAGDLLCYSAETTAALQTSGLLGNLMSLPYFDLERCVDSHSANELMAGESLYMLPDPAAQAYDNAYVVFYDRTLVRQTGLPLPETLVKQGAWDMDAFKRYTEAVAVGVMGRPSVDLKQDVFGYSASDSSSLLPYLLWCCQGKRVIQPGENGVLTVAYTYETLADETAKLKEIYTSDARLPQDGSEARQAFADGRLGFYIDKLDYLRSLYSNSTREYGLLPLPKEAVSRGNVPRETYTSPVDTSGRVLSVPASVEDRVRVGIGLTAICAAGGPLLRQAEKQTYISLYSLDNDQSCMLEIILDSTTFDFGWVFGTQNKPTYHLNRGMFTEVFAEGSNFKTILRQYGEQFAEYAAELGR